MSSRHMEPRSLRFRSFHALQRQRSEPARIVIRCTGWGYFLPPAESDGLEKFLATLERETSPDRFDNRLVRLPHQHNERRRWLVQQSKVHVIVVPLAEIE